MKSQVWRVYTTNQKKLLLGEDVLELMLCGRGQSVFYFYLKNFVAYYTTSADDRFSTQKALQTVVAGQQAENLLYVVTLLDLCHTLNSQFSDFDDAPAIEGQPSGLAATEVLSQTPAAANLLAGTSTNPLDDLVSIFGGGGGSLSAATPGGFAFGGGSSFGQGLMSPATPSLASGVASPMVGQGLTPARSPAPPPPQQQQPQDDLLGLF